jgi:DNA-binding winged helix-turn-helix (wHTH) protein/TolB-like protein/Tfp pilus assembly protein PilF
MVASLNKEHLYEFGPFCIDPRNRLLLKDQEQVSLAPKAFDTLLVLIENSGRLLERDELIRMVWPDSFVEDINLTVHISMLRKALGDSPDDPRYIATVPKRGYRFVATVSALRSDAVDRNEKQADTLTTPVGPKSDKAEEEKPAASNGSSSLLLRAGPLRKALVLLLLPAFLAGLSYIWFRRATEGTKAADDIESIAVLPFKSLVPDDNDEHFGIGMADALITRLSNVKQIVVRPTSSVLKYGRSDQDPLAAGRELGVDSLLDGKIQRQGDRVRISVQLIKVSDGATLWGEDFEKSFTGILEAQSAISEQVVEALMLRLTGEEKHRLVKRYTENPEAYQYYQKGRYFWNKRTQSGFEKAIEYFNRAIEKDPTFALAHTGIADSYAMLSDYLFLPPHQGFPKAKQTALKALEIDEQLAEAHCSLGFIKEIYEWDWPGAEKAYQRALELNPNYGTAYHWYAIGLSARGRFDGAISMARRALEINPTDLVINRNLGQIYYFARRYDDAIEQYKKTLEMDPGFIPVYRPLALAYAQKKMYGKAIETIRKAIRQSDGMLEIATLGHVYALSGRKKEAQKIADQLKDMSKRGYVSHYCMALIYTALGDNDQAFRWLERAYDEREKLLTRLNVHPELDSLRSDPRFARLLRRTGLAY